MSDPDFDNDSPMDLGSIKPTQLQFTFEGENNTPVISNLDEIQEAEFVQDPCTYREGDIIHPHSPIPGQQRAHGGSRARLIGPLRYIDPKTCTTAAKAVEQLSRGLPMNETSLPEYVFRADMLDPMILASAVREFNSTTTSSVPAQAPVAGIEEANSMLEAAMLPLSYSEGFPALQSGMPFWNQLEFEPAEAFQAFIGYLELGGARSIAGMISYDMDDILEWFHVYFWAYRVKAYDMFKVVNHHRIKLSRMMLVEDDHFAKASRLMKKLDTYIGDITIDETNMTPDRAVAMLEKLVKIQRISVGLPAQGESKETNPTRRMQDTKQLMSEADADNHAVEEEDDSMDLLMDNPDSVDLAQELIIRMQQAKQVN